MALDAAFLTYIRRELDDTLSGAFVDKIYQPSRDEIILRFRGEGKHSLMLSCAPNAARAHLTDVSPENPKVPPNFCMVLRKHLGGARLKRVVCPAFERVLCLEFDAKNEFFEPVEKTLLLEILGRSANIILIDENHRIVNAVRYADLSAHSREILPGLPYEMPPLQGKIPFLDASPVDPLWDRPADTELWAALMDTYAGICPLTAREICYRAVYATDKRIGDLSAPQKERVAADIAALVDTIRAGRWNGVMLRRRSDGKTLDFTFTPVRQYGAACYEIPQPSPSALLEEFYTKEADARRMRQRSDDLLNFLARTGARIKRTRSVRQKELENSKSADTFRVYGEIIQANLGAIRKGDRTLTAANFYDPALAEVSIPLAPDKSPIQNAAAYFKKYNKAKKGAGIIAELIRKDDEELAYLDSVFVALCDAETEEDIGQIRAELISCGYLKPRGGKDIRKPDLSGPRRFITDDGYTVLVGKNNLQNDHITVRLSRKGDIWMHTKDVHGSHTLLVTGGKALEDIPDNTLLQAASLCAFYSKAKNDGKVSVDYCPVGHVKKPAGARPGMVVYEGYYTVVVTPDEKLAERIRCK